MRDAIRARTGRKRNGTTEEIVKDLNRVIRGWYAYFKHAYKRDLTTIDGFVRRRLRALFSYRKKGGGRGKDYVAHKTWPIAYFVELGLYTMRYAHEGDVVAAQALAHQSRCGNC